MSASRKYERYFKPISKSQFSTAGTIRSQGRVGQTSLSRSLVNTPFRGVEPRGNGGCCGTYDKNIVNSCCATTPSNGQTSINTIGLKLSRVKHPTSVFNYSCQDSCKIDVLNKGKKPIPPSTKQFGSVKDFSPLNHSQSSLIKNKNAKIMQSEWNSVNGKLGKKNGNIAKVPPVATSSSQYMKTQFVYNNPTHNCC